MIKLPQHIPWRKEACGLGFATDMLCEAIARTVFFDASIPVPPFNDRAAKTNSRIELRGLLHMALTGQLDLLASRAAVSDVRKTADHVAGYRRQLGVPQIPACKDAWDALEPAAMLVTAYQDFALGPAYTGDFYLHLSAVSEALVPRFFDDKTAIDVAASWWARQFLPDMTDPPDPSLIPAIAASIMAEEWSCADSVALGEPL